MKKKTLSEQLEEQSKLLRDLHNDNLELYRLLAKIAKFRTIRLR